jgi:hypothetical protein
VSCRHRYDLLSPSTLTPEAKSGSELSCNEATVLVIPSEVENEAAWEAATWTEGQRLSEREVSESNLSLLFTLKLEMSPAFA